MFIAKCFTNATFCLPAKEGKVFDELRFFDSGWRTLVTYLLVSPRVVLTLQCFLNTGDYHTNQDEFLRRDQNLKNSHFYSAFVSLNISLSKRRKNV